MKIITIGRSSECDIIINDPYVGRTHLQMIVSDDGSCYCVDLNSKNGTFVNGRRISSKVRLNKADVIRIGNTTLPWQQYVGDPKTNKNRKPFWITMIAVGVVLLVCVGLGIYCNDNDSDIPMNIPELQNSDDTKTEINVSSGKQAMKAHPQRTNAKPTADHIQYDLIGHTLSEGVSDGYHEKDWTYEIKNNSISFFNIEDILVDDGNSYTAVASCHLKGGDNYYYDTKLKISYSHNESEWKLSYVNSLGMNVVSDGQYDDCIICSLADDGWGGVNCLNIRNISECSLVVAGRIRTSYNGWLKFSKVASPHKSIAVGGTFSGGSVQDYIIDFVVREQ